jgi:hypothetical protein
MINKPRNRRYLGILKIRANQKHVWLSKEDKNGWSLGYALNKKTFWLTGLRFKSKRDISDALENSSIVYVELKNKCQK